MPAFNHTAQQPILPTITAIATPIGRGGVGVIRLSGSQAHAIAQALTKKNLGKNPNFTPRHAHFCRFYDDDNSVIDEGIVLYFPAPYSFTGEDIIELQGHGGMILQQQLLARLYALGAKQAIAGEFSARAFDNDKLDLVQAEAIADAIDATSVAAAKSALRSLTGEFSQKIHTLLELLIHLRLHVEAAIDFPDEEAVDFLADEQIANQLKNVQRQVNAVLATAKQGQLLRDGVSVVIAGRPNAGKSSLLNCLAGQERAIVTDIAGTTRDVLHETIVLNGLTLNLTDTAGLHDTQDAVEKIGIERAREAINKADILLLMYDLTQEADPITLAKKLFGELPDKQRLLLVGNKLDLLEASTIKKVSRETLKKTIQGYSHIEISCTTKEGLSEFSQLLCDKVGFHPPENSLIARTRHLDALHRTANALEEASVQLHAYHAGELVAESLHQAQQSLGEITGVFTADDLLGKIFGSFCIGK